MDTEIRAAYFIFPAQTDACRMLEHNIDKGSDSQSKSDSS
jgi:hypothetical protein